MKAMHDTIRWCACAMRPSVNFSHNTKTTDSFIRILLVGNERRFICRSAVIYNRFDDQHSAARKKNEFIVQIPVSVVSVAIL